MSAAAPPSGCFARLALFRRSVAGDSHTDQVLAVAALGAAGDRFVTGSADKTGRVWDAATGAEVCKAEGHTDQVLAVAALGAAGDRFVTGSADQTARVWDAATGAEVSLAAGHTGGVSAVAALGVDGDRFVTGSEDHTARVWDSATGVLLLNVSRRGVLELYGWMPIVEAATGLAQAVGLAFSDNVKWNRKAIAPIVVPIRLSLLDFTLPTVSPESQFYGKACCAVSAAFAYVLLAMFRKLAFAVKFFSGLCVVPLVKQLASVVDCHTNEEHRYVLDAVPAITCFARPHIYLAILAVVGGGGYFAMLLPLTGAEGNVHDVEPGTLCQPSAWVRARHRRAQCTNYGPLQPKPEHMKWTAYADLLSRVALVIIFIETTYRPQMQMILSTSVCAATAAVFAIKPPYQDATMSAAVVAAKVIKTAAFGCGVLAAHVDDSGSLKAPLLFYALSFTACASLIVYSACCAPRRKPEGDASPTIAGLLWDRGADGPSADAEQRALL